MSKKTHPAKVRNNAFTLLPNIKGPKNYTVGNLPNSITRVASTGIISCQLAWKNKNTISFYNWWFSF